MAADLIVNIVSIIVIAVLISTALLPKKLNYAVNGCILLLLGLIPILFELEVIPFTFGEAGIIKYTVTVVVMFSAKTLIVEAVKEEHALRWITLSMGVLLVILSIVPSLHALGALTFTIPNYPPMVNNIMYVVASLFLFVGIFLARSD